MNYFISMLSTTGGKLKVSPKEILKNYNKIKNIINGGRYDQLISDLGSKTKVSAVGAALNLNY